MKKYLQKKLNNEKGMTLIELLAVIVIIAIIAAIAIPAIGNIIENSRVGTMKSDNLNAIAAAELYLLDNPTAPTVALEDLVGKAESPDGSVKAKAAYLDTKGSLTDFTYTASSKTVVSSAKQGTMTLEIKTGGANKSQINAYANSDRTEKTNITAAKAK